YQKWLLRTVCVQNDRLGVNDLDKRAFRKSGLARMFGRLVMYAALLVALGIIVVSACAPQQEAVPSPTAAVPVPSASRAPTATPTVASPVTLTARPSASPTVPASPGSSPAAACPRLTGGGAANQAQLVGVRIA